MAFNNYRNSFQGELNNTKVSELGVLDRSKENFKDRLEFIIKKYEKTIAFYETFIDKYYKCSINTTDSLSGEINIFKFIESDGTYLLNSLDLKEEDKRSCDINKKSIFSLDDLGQANDFLVEKNIENYRLAPKIDILKKDFRVNQVFAGTYSDYLMNNKKSNTIKKYIEKSVRTNKKIFKKEEIDKSKIPFGEVSYNNILSEEQFKRFVGLELAKVNILSELNTYKLKLMELKKTLQQNSFQEEELETNRRNQLRMVINSLKELKADMIYCKTHLTPYVEISPDKCSAEIDLCGSMDYSNPTHVKNALLLKPSDRVSTDFNIIAYDIQRAIEGLIADGQLTEYEIELIELYRVSVSNMVYVAKELNKHRKQVYRDLDKIVHKITKKLSE